MSHAYHETLPGYRPEQILHDGCPECEDRADRTDHGLSTLGLDTFRQAWARAVAVNKNQVPFEERSTAEMPLLNMLWSVQVLLEQCGVPIGSLPPGPEWTVLVLPKMSGE